MADEPKKLPTILSGIIATLSAFSLGTALGWASPAGIILEEKEHMSSDSIGWIGSIFNLGAASAMLPVGFILQILGRKWTMLALSLPFVCGWMFIAFAKSSVAQMCVGRFILGFCGGAYCVCTPIFTAEIAHPSIRGFLGVFFQLQITIGILFAYCIGFFDEMIVMCLLSAAIPIIFFVLMSLFVKESPMGFAEKHKDERALEALEFYRGKDYKNLADEMKDIKNDMAAVHRMREAKVPFKELYLTKSTIKAFIVCVSLQVLQQLSGINAIIFYSEKIFKSAKLEMSARIPPVIMGVVQVLATFVAALLVDRAGRKLLMIVSLAVMGVCNLLVGIYFKMQDVQGASLSVSWSYMPVASVCLYILGFSLGAGPIPWAMLGELFAPQVKGPVASSCAFINWMLAFCVVKSFSPIVDVVGEAIIFWIFAIICFGGVAFTYFFCIETKGKTLDEIQQELGA